MSMYLVHVVPGERGAVVMTDCEQPCGCLELNPGPLEESVLLTDESSLQSQGQCCLLQATSTFNFIFMCIGVKVSSDHLELEL